jgi:hypothetical protein
VNSESLLLSESLLTRESLLINELLLLRESLLIIELIINESVEELFRFESAGTLVNSISLEGGL